MGVIKNQEILLLICSKIHTMSYLQLFLHIDTAKMKLTKLISAVYI